MTIKPRPTITAFWVLLCAACLLSGCAENDSTSERVTPTTTATAIESTNCELSSPVEQISASQSTSTKVTVPSEVSTTIFSGEQQTTAAVSAPTYAGKVLSVKKDAVQVLRVPYTEALTADKGAPLYAKRMENKEELMHFREENTAWLSTGGEAERALSRYDAAFFADRILIAAYIGATSGSYRFGLDRLSSDGNTLHLYIKRTAPQETSGTWSMLTADMAGWLVLIEANASDVRTAVNLDACLSTGN